MGSTKKIDIFVPCLLTIIFQHCSGYGSAQLSSHEAESPKLVLAIIL
jgi:hypothetical protein